MKTLPLLGILVLILSGTACTHVQTDSRYLPNPYTFPSQFYVEQELTIRSLRESKVLKAQLERKGEIITAVFADPQSSMVLVRLELRTGQDPKFVYQAPILEKTNFAAAKIARAIQYLYESRDIPLRSGEYIVRGPSKRFVYTFTSMQGSSPCQFPDEIELTFDDERYDVQIELKQLDCAI